MSAYKVVKCEVSEINHIIAGLNAIGIPIDLIEIHETPQPLVGYHGDKRTQKANVIVRRAIVNKLLSGGASNDLGFEKVDGKFVAHVSDYDHSWWNKKQSKFQQAAAEAKVTSEAEKRGYRVEKKTEGNNIKLKLIKMT